MPWRTSVTSGAFRGEGKPCSLWAWLMATKARSIVATFFSAIASDVR